MTSTTTFVPNCGRQTTFKKKTVGIIALTTIGGFAAFASGSSAQDFTGVSIKDRVSGVSPARGGLRDLPGSSALRLFAKLFPGHSENVPSFTAGRYIKEDNTDFDDFNGPSTPNVANPFQFSDIACDLNGPKAHSATIDTTMAAVLLFVKDHFSDPVTFDNNTVSGVEGHYHFRDTTGLFSKKVFTFVYKHDLKCTQGPITSEIDYVRYSYFVSALQCADKSRISSFTVRDGCTTVTLNIDSVAMIDSVVM